MYKIDNREYRNLQEQVLKNKEDIAAHYAMDRALANLGIRIVGTLDSASELPGATLEHPLPAAPDYTGEYGDTYAVGETAPYTYWVFTRPDLNNNQTTDYWLNVGKISVVGPQGPQGPRGETGAPGLRTRWYFGTSIPTVDAIDGDCFLITEGSSKGDLYGYQDGTWIRLLNIMGPQGIQGIRGSQGVPGVGTEGPQGPQGLPGSVPIKIYGTVSESSQLPIPAESIISRAYLVGVEPPYHLWAIKQDTMVWIDLGEFAAVSGQDGAQGPRGLPGLDGNSIVSYSGVIVALPLLNTQYTYNPDLVRTTSVLNDDLILDRNANIYRVLDYTGATCTWTGVNLKGPQGEQGAPGSSNNTCIIDIEAQTEYGSGYKYYILPDRSRFKKMTIVRLLNFTGWYGDPWCMDTNILIYDEPTRTQQVNITFQTDESGNKTTTTLSADTKGLLDGSIDILIDRASGQSLPTITLQLEFK